jgi:hypothetical protein
MRITIGSVEILIKLAHHSLQILIVALAMVRDLILHQMMPLRNL